MIYPNWLMRSATGSGKTYISDQALAFNAAPSPIPFTLIDATGAFNATPIVIPFKKMKVAKVKATIKTKIF